jgi:hypothetical protein
LIAVASAQLSQLPDALVAVEENHDASMNLVWDTPESSLSQFTGAFHRCRVIKRPMEPLHVARKMGRPCHQQIQSFGRQVTYEDRTPSDRLSSPALPRTGHSRNKSVINFLGTLCDLWGSPAFENSSHSCSLPPLPSNSRKAAISVGTGGQFRRN